VRATYVTDVCAPLLYERLADPEGVRA